MLDVCLAQNAAKEQILYLVFEHLEQDLADYLYSLPPNIQLAPNVVQVSTSWTGKPLKNTVDILFFAEDVRGDPYRN